MQFAQEDLKDFQNTVDIAQAQFKAGAISEADYLKIKLQLLAVSDRRVLGPAGQGAGAGRRSGSCSATTPCRQITTSWGTWPTSRSKTGLEDLQAKALRERPDFQAALLGVTAAQSQIQLAKANSKVDVNGTYDFTHTAGQNSASIFASFDLPIFNRNQGEIARTRYALTQAQETQQSASDTVLSDVANAYEAVTQQRRSRAALHLRISEAGAGLARHQRVRLQSAAPPACWIFWTRSAATGRPNWPIARPWLLI